MAVSGSIIDLGQVSNVTEKYYCLQSNRAFCGLLKNFLAAGKRQLILVHIFLHHIELLILYFKNATYFFCLEERRALKMQSFNLFLLLISICQTGHTKSQPDSTGKKRGRMSNRAPSVAEKFSQASVFQLDYKVSAGSKPKFFALQGFLQNW